MKFLLTILLTGFLFFWNFQPLPGQSCNTSISDIQTNNSNSTNYLSLNASGFSTGREYVYTGTGDLIIDDFIIQNSKIKVTKTSSSGTVRIRNARLFDHSVLLINTQGPVIIEGTNDYYNNEVQKDEALFLTNNCKLIVASRGYISANPVGTSEARIGIYQNSALRLYSCNYISLDDYNIYAGRCYNSHCPLEPGISYDRSELRIYAKNEIDYVSGSIHRRNASLATSAAATQFYDFMSSNTFKVPTYSHIECPGSGTCGETAYDMEYGNYALFEGGFSIGSLEIPVPLPGPLNYVLVGPAVLYNQFIGNAYEAACPDLCPAGKTNWDYQLNAAHGPINLNYHMDELSEERASDITDAELLEIQAKIVGLKSKFQLKLSPNPIEKGSDLKISYWVLPLQADLTIQLHDPLGKLIRQEVFSNLVPGPVNDQYFYLDASLSSGMYWLTIRSAGFTETAKLFIF